MSSIIERIAERYADEIAGLPSLGTLTSFLLISTAAHVIEQENLKWIPPIPILFSIEFSKFFDTSDGIITKTSIGALTISAFAAFMVRTIYSKFNSSVFLRLSKAKIISAYVESANKAAISSGITNSAIDENCTTFLSQELSLQRKSFQRIHGSALVAFTIALMSLASIYDLRSFFALCASLICFVWLQYLAIRHYLTKLFPALCVVWATKGKSAQLGIE